MRVLNVKTVPTDAAPWRVLLCVLGRSALGLWLATPAYAQAPPPAPPAATPVTADASTTTAQPPVGSAPVLRTIEIRFPTQDNVSAIDPQTYVHYIGTQPSRPSLDRWVPWTPEIEQSLLADYRRLWATNFLDDLTLSVEDRPYPNGVIGKHVLFELEERPRVKIIDYVGTKQLDQTAIDDKLREMQIQIRPDSFLDEGMVRRIKGIIRQMLSEKGFHDSSVTHATKPVGGQKLVHLTMTIDEGPKYKVRSIDFVGNSALSDRTLRRRMKETKEMWPFSFITGRGTYKEAKYEEDAEKLQAFYRERGHITTQVGNPEIRTLETTDDGRTRYVQLRIPVMEGPRYRVGAVKIADNTVVKSEALLPIFKIKTGDFYNEQHVRKGMEKARELYGAGGYWEFTGYPSFARKDDVADNATPAERAEAAKQPAIVDVTLHMQEGEQYFVNRITFTGNSTTRDRVIRRELPLVESGVFNTEALKSGVQRLNQLGYFKPLEPERVKVEKTPAMKNQVDVTLALQEENRNQIQFGAGFSELDGVFLNGSYGTSNFLGQGETLQIAVQRGARSNNYQFSISEPYVFDRPISAGIVLFTRKIDYLMSTGDVGYSEARTGVSVTGGYALRRFMRLFNSYSYEVIDSAISDAFLDDDSGGPGDPIFNLGLDEGRHIESRLAPALVYNTVDHPFSPRRGIKISGSYEVAGGLLGGDIDYIRPDAEVILYIPHTRRTALGLRAQAGWIKPYGNTETLPYYRRFFLGGETQIRGVELRTVGPLDENNRALGGDKFVLFNAEYYFDIAGPVRALVFHDAGQAYSEEQRINLRELRTSSGVELRVMVPMLNVPFRLIYAWNVYRDTFQPARAFRFAVGTTF